MVIHAKVGRTELTNDITEDVFIDPPFGPGTYARVMGEIDAAGLVRPTFGNKVVLYHEALQNPGENFSAKIIDIARRNWFIADTSILNLPEQRAYVQDHPQTDGNGRPVMTEKELEQKLQDKDPSVRFAEDYVTGELTKNELIKHSLNMALCADKDTANLSGRLAGMHKYNPRVFALTNVEKPTVTFASLGSFWGGFGVGVNGRVLGPYGLGFAFGVAPDQE